MERQQVAVTVQQLLTCVWVMLLLLLLIFMLSHLEVNSFIISTLKDEIIGSL